MSSLPAAIRANLQVPFPAFVQGVGPVVVSKANGIWQIILSTNLLAQQIPPPGNFATDFVIVWDDINKDWFKMPISAFPSGGGGATAPTQRLVTTSPITVVSSDNIINCNIPTGTPACTLPSYISRLGLPVTFKDMGQASAHPITITPFAGDTIDGGGAIVLNNDRQSVTLVPYNDGTSTGWAIE